jgi:hypothetical protein
MCFLEAMKRAAGLSQEQIMRQLAVFIVFFPFSGNGFLPVVLIT